MVPAAPLLDTLSRFSGLRAGVLGDLMVDRFIYGDAQRISPEAPVPVVAIRRRATQPGGAANVANNVLALGSACWLSGLLGDDSAGGEIRVLLAAEGCDASGILSPQGYESTIKTRVVAQSQQLLRIDEEHAQPVDAQTEEALLAQLTARLPQLDVLIVSDYAKGVLTPTVARGVVSACRAAGVPVVVDPKPSSLQLYAGADVLKPNLGEALRALGLDAPPDGGMEQVCRDLRELSAARAIIVTAGSRGLHVLNGEDGYTHLPGHPRAVYDVAGAGDSTLAAIGLGLAAGLSLRDSAQLGNLAGSLAVGKLGVATVTAAELAAEIEADHAADA